MSGEMISNKGGTISQFGMMMQEDMKKMQMMYGQELEGLGDRLGKWAAHVVSLLSPALLAAIILGVLCCWHRRRRQVSAHAPYERMIEDYGKGIPVWSQRKQWRLSHQSSLNRIEDLQMNTWHKTLIKS